MTPPAAPDDDGDPTGLGGHGRPPWLLVVVGVVLVLVLGGFWFASRGEKVQQTSEDEARSRLTPGATAPAGTEATGASPMLGGPPAAGLYRYTGSGREHTSFPELSEDQGPAMPATVTLKPDGCWVFRIDYNTHHWQEWTMCTVGGQLTEQTGSTFSRRNIGGLDIDNTSTFVCTPPVVVVAAPDQDGSVRPRSCVGSGSLIKDPSTAAGTMTVVGHETIDVGGQAIPTVHVRDDLSYSGAQSGSEKSDNWYDVRTGLPVRNSHDITVITTTPFGEITYTETSTFTLQTPSPV